MTNTFFGLLSCCCMCFCVIYVFIKGTTHQKNNVANKVKGNSAYTSIEHCQWTFSLLVLGQFIHVLFSIPYQGCLMPNTAGSGVLTNSGARVCENDHYLVKQCAKWSLSHPHLRLRTTRRNMSCQQQRQPQKRQRVSGLVLSGSGCKKSTIQITSTGYSLVLAGLLIFTSHATMGSWTKRICALNGKKYRCCTTWLPST